MFSFEQGRVNYLKLASFYTFDLKFQKYHLVKYLRD